MFQLQPYICHRILEMFTYQDFRSKGVCNHIDDLITADMFIEEEVDQIAPVLSHLKVTCIDSSGQFIKNPDKGLLEILGTQGLNGYWEMRCNSLLCGYNNLFNPVAYLLDTQA